jgi:hypothetical protein
MNLAASCEQPPDVKSGSYQHLNESTSEGLEMPPSDFLGAGYPSGDSSLSPSKASAVSSSSRYTYPDEDDSYHSNRAPEPSTDTQDSLVRNAADFGLAKSHPEDLGLF